MMKLGDNKFLKTAYEQTLFASANVDMVLSFDSKNDTSVLKPILQKLREAIALLRKIGGIEK
jgi:hypothetical protein